jgi:CheY-like chemotaxis protein
MPGKPAATCSSRLVLQRTSMEVSIMDSHSVDVELQPDCTTEPLVMNVARTDVAQAYLARSQPRAERTVLCVDGDEQVRSVLRQALGGYELAFVSTGYEALRSLNLRAFDLYVLDYWLPDWSGVSLCRDIRKVDPHVPVCFCTGATQPQNQKRADRAGASAYFLKPADPQLVSGEISMLMQFRGSRNEAARGAALAAVREELQRRLAALPAGSSPEQVEVALKRCARTKARNAFLDMGGTLAGFERVWEPLWNDVWTSRA